MLQDLPHPPEFDWTSLKSFLSSLTALELPKILSKDYRPDYQLAIRFSHYIQGLTAFSVKGFSIDEVLDKWLEPKGEPFKRLLYNGHSLMVDLHFDTETICLAEITGSKKKEIYLLRRLYQSQTGEHKKLSSADSLVEKIFELSRQYQK